MPPALIAGGVMAGLSAGGQILSGITQRNLSNQEAGLETQAAVETRQATGQQIAGQEYQANQLISKGLANAAAGGVAPNSGSSAMVTRTNRSAEILNSAVTRYSGNLQSNALLAQAAFSRWSGQNALTSGIIGAGGSILTAGFGSPTTPGPLSGYFSRLVN